MWKKLIAPALIAGAIGCGGMGAGGVEFGTAANAQGYPPPPPPDTTNRFYCKRSCDYYYDEGSQIWQLCYQYCNENKGF